MQTMDWVVVGNPAVQVHDLFRLVTPRISPPPSEHSVEREGPPKDDRHSWPGRHGADLEGAGTLTTTE